MRHRQTEQNKLVHDVKQKGNTYEEHTEFLFSDHVATELAPFIGGQMSGRPPLQLPPMKRGDVPILPVPKGLIEGPMEQEAVEVEQTQTNPEASSAEETLQRASGFFRRDGDILLAETKDYKGTYWAEQQRRFILLYASAYEHLLGKPVPNNAHIKAAAEKANIVDKNNFTRYLGEEIKKNFLSTSTGLVLNRDGKQEVLRVTAEIDNPQVAEGEAYWGKSQAEASLPYTFCIGLVDGG